MSTAKDTKQYVIGGSDVAACVGLNPHVSPIMQWARMTGRVEQPESEAMYWGTALEPLIRERVGELGYTMFPGHFTLTDYNRPWRVGHVDGMTIVNGKQAVFEAKTAGHFAHRAGWDEGLPPVEYVCQAQWYMDLGKCEYALIAVLVGGQRLELHTIRRNHIACRLLIKYANEFRRYLEEDRQPPPDASDSARAALLALHPEATVGERVRLTGEDWQTFEQLSMLRAKRDALDSQIGDRENKLKQALGDAEFGVSPADLDAIRWQQVTSQRLDTKALRADHPELAAEYSHTTSTRRFTVLKGES